MSKAYSDLLDFARETQALAAIAGRMTISSQKTLFSRQDWGCSPSLGGYSNTLASPGTPG